MCVCTHAFLHDIVCICGFVCMCVCTHVFVCVFACVYMCVCSMQLHYSLGCHCFWQDDFKLAHSHFKQCASLLEPPCPSLVNDDQLKGYLCACAQVMAKMKKEGSGGADEGGNEEGEGEDMMGEVEGGLRGEGVDLDKQTLLEKLEYCRISDTEVTACIHVHVHMLHT